MHYDSTGPVRFRALVAFVLLARARGAYVLIRKARYRPARPWLLPCAAQCKAPHNGRALYRGPRVRVKDRVHCHAFHVERAQPRVGACARTTNPPHARHVPVHLARNVLIARPVPAQVLDMIPLFTWHGGCSWPISLPESELRTRF